jgi:hypothetical protein
LSKLDASSEGKLNSEKAEEELRARDDERLRQTVEADVTAGLAEQRAKGTPSKGANWITLCVVLLSLGIGFYITNSDSGWAIFFGAFAFVSRRFKRISRGLGVVSDHLSDWLSRKL